MKPSRLTTRPAGAVRTPSRLAVAALLLTAAFAAPAAEPGGWELVSPDGGSIVQLARGDEARHVYAVSSLGALFRSTDGGEHWSAQAQHIDGQRIRAVGPSPAAPNLVLGNNGRMQRSTDGGATWEETDGRFSSILSFAFASSDASRVYAAGPRTWRSDDGGTTWTPLDQPANEIVVDEADPDRLWAGYAGGVAYSEDGGATWVDRLTSVFVSHLAIDRGEPHTLWAATFSGLWVSEDDGVSWAKKLPPAPLRETIRQVEARTDVDGQALVVASRYKGQSQILEADVAFYVSDGGDTWIMFPERPREILAVLPVVEEPVFAPGLFAPRGLGIVEGPFRRSGFVSSIGLQATETDFFAVPDLAPSTLYAHDPTDRDLVTSRHGGKLWQRRSLNVSDLVVAPSDPRWIYAPAGGDLLRSVDGGETFTAAPLPAGIGFYDFLTVHPANPEVLRLVMTADEPCFLLPPCPPPQHRLFASDDAGSSWRQIDTPGAPNALVTDLLIDPRSKAGEAPVEYLLHVDELYVRNPAEGADWVPVGDPALGSAVELAAQTTKGGGLVLFVRTVRHDEPVWRTVDGGEVWKLLTDGYPAHPDAIPLALAAAPRPGGRVVVGTAQHGVFHLVDGERWEPLGDLGPLFVDQLAVAAGSDVTFARSDGRLYRYGLATDCVPPPAGEQAAHLCLGAGDRFRVEIDWQDFQGGYGVGRGEELTRDAGYFWFFRPTNAEMAVKVLDGRTVNGNRWVFYGALTNVPFDLTVTDTVEGDYQTYSNPSRNFASRGDTAAFPTGGMDEPVVAGLDAEAGAAAPALAAAEPSAGCPADERILCLHDGRFLVEADWEDFQGGAGAATPVPLTSDSGYLWFFRPSNLELFVKVLDGRKVNGHWWVFYGSLSNVAFELRVTDTLSGQTNTYTNPSGTFASRGDDQAFEPVE